VNGEVPTTEAAFAAAVLDRDAAVPPSVLGRNGATPERRFAVYRNNVYASLVDVLAGRFPVTAKLVGADFFWAMARLHAEQTPPSSPVLLGYGAGFPDFIGAFPPAQAVPYLADVARLEWAWHVACHATDATPLDLAALAAAQSSPNVFLRLHPSARLVRSVYPVVTIWELGAREGEGAPARLPAVGEDALVIRPELDVEVRRLPRGGGAFLSALIDAAPLEAAAEQAAAADSAFDLAVNLAGLMTSRAITGIAGDNSS
jgi:hypothetical protein